MTKRRILLAALACGMILAAVSAQAQVSSYTFRTDNTAALAYSALSGTPVASGDAVEDQFYSNIPIGFSFTFNGANYTTLHICANGYVIFGGQAPANQSGFYSPLGQPLGDGAIAALGVDLRGLAGGRIVTQAIGSAPNRSFIVQWQNFGVVRFSNAAPADTVNFQIRLDETTNGVSIAYGTFAMSNVNSFDCEVGLRGGSEVNARETQPATDALPDPWAASAAGASADLRCRLTVTQGASGNPVRGVPQNNLVFAWNAAASLPTPTLVSPADGALATIPGAFAWNAVQGATSYEFTLIAPNGGTYDPIATQTPSVTFSNASNAGYAGAMFATPGVFSWRVQAVGADGLKSPASETRKFTPRAQPVIKSLSERTFTQGKTVATTITAENVIFSSGALPKAQFTPASGQGFSATVTVSTPAAITATADVPANASLAPHSLSIISGQDTLRLADAITVVSADNPPVTSEFSPTVHGFNFCNCGDKMWDAAIYGKIDYNSPAYPAEVRALSPQPQDFPSWDDFVAVYERGTGQSAFTGAGATRTPVQEALTQWRSSKKAWGGSCGGFAITALMAYSGKYSFSGQAYQIQLNDNLRSLINRNQVSQSYGNILGGMDDAPNQTVQKIRANFSQSKADQFLVAIFNIVNGENKGGHALVPYKIVTTLGSTGDVIDNVYVWDMNYPGDNNRVVVVNRTKNTWQYFGFLNSDEISQGAPPWQGPNGFFPYLSANSAAAVSQLPVLAGKRSRGGSTLAGSTKTEPPVEIYFADDNDAKNALAPRVTVTNRFKQSVANYGAYMISPQIPGARVQLPISTGANVDAPGITIPKQPLNAYRLQYKPTKDGSANFAAAFWKRLTAWGYWEAPSSSGTQTLDIDFDRDAVRLVAAATGTDAELALAKTDPTDSLWENTVTIRDFQVAAGDSLELRLINDGNSFVVTNYGAARTYGLYMERYDTTSFNRIRIGAKESHTLLIEDWDNIGTCDVLVQVDRGLKSKVDTSYFLRRNGVLTDVRGATALSGGELLRLETYPNPASAEARVTYALPAESFVTAEIYNLLGQRVATLAGERQSIGRHTLLVNTRDLENGVYLVRLQAAGRTATQTLRVAR